MTVRLAYLNGDFLPEKTAAVSVFDAAVLFGEIITETVRTFRHRPFRLVDPDAFALMLDLNGNVAECTGGNFFIVHGGKLVTAPTTTVLDGVTRSVTIEIAGRLGIPVEERLFNMCDVYNADEAFQTSTPFCIMPVTRANGVEIADSSPGSLTRRLMQEWNALAGFDLVAQALRRVQAGKRPVLEEMWRKQQGAT